MKQKETSLHNLRKMIAATRRYYQEHRIRSARGERRRDIASRAQPAIVSRLIAGGGASMPSFGPPPVGIGRNGIECGECQATGKEPADMRLPCNRLSTPAMLIELSPEQQVD